MAEIRNGLVVVRSGEEESLLLLAAAAAGHPPSYDNLGAGSSAGSLGVPPAGLVSSRMRRTGGGSLFPASRPPGLFEHDHDPGEERHFLDSCSMCKRPLRTDQDIFMYRGNIPFCSEECRQDQIDTDEMKDRKWSNLAAKAMLSARNKDTSVAFNRATGTVVA